MSVKLPFTILWDTKIYETLYDIEVLIRREAIKRAIRRMEERALDPITGRPKPIVFAELRDLDEEGK